MTRRTPDFPSCSDVSDCPDCLDCPDLSDCAELADGPDLTDCADCADRDLRDPFDGPDLPDGPDHGDELARLDASAELDHDLTLARPAELAAAVPVLLGFHPRDSLVLVSVGGTAGNRVGLTLRVDLPSPSATAVELSALRATVVDGLLRDRPRGAAVLVFAADGAEPPRRRLVGALAADLEDSGVRVIAALWAESTAAGARWACYEPCGCRGTLPDPATTAVAVAGVLDGRVVHGSRSELSRLVEPVDPARLERREELLAAAPPVLDEPVTRAGELGQACSAAEEEEGALLRAAAQTLDRAVTDAAAGRLLLDDARVVALARALAAPAVRDEALSRCIGRQARAAEDLWLALVRETPDPEAAEPAALLAVSALQRGDGGLANVALDRAERAWPGHRLTRTLRQLAAAGLPPSDVRELLRDSLAGRALPAGALRPAGGSARSAMRRRPSS
jgi:hypothetical protein